MSSQQEYRSGYNAAAEIDISALCNTASRCSISSLPLRTVNSARPQIRHSWPEEVFVEMSKPSRHPGTSIIGAAASASTPNLSSSNMMMATPALLCTPRRIQFAGDVLEDWLVADSLLPAPPTLASYALIAAGPPSSASDSAGRRVHFTGEEFEDEDDSNPLLSPRFTSPGTLTRAQVVLELDSTPNSAAPAPSTAQIRPAGIDSDVLPAPSPIAAHRPTHSAPPSHISFLPPRNEHNSHCERKPKTRPASPCPRRRPASMPADTDNASRSSATTCSDDPATGTRDLQLTRVHAHAQKKTARGAHAFSARLQDFRLKLKLKQRRLQRLGFTYGGEGEGDGDGEVRAYNKRPVKTWVAEQRRDGGPETRRGRHVMADSFEAGVK